MGRLGRISRLRGGDQAASPRAPILLGKRRCACPYCAQHGVRPRVSGGRGDRDRLERRRCERTSARWGRACARRTVSRRGRLRRRQRVRSATRRRRDRGASARCACCSARYICSISCCCRARKRRRPRATTVFTPLELSR
ncbi:unnamed protein product [Ectocarpus sp. 12 AP-2014]